MMESSTKRSWNLLVLVGYLLSLTSGQYITAPIEISSVQVTPDKHSTNVTVRFTSLEPTKVTWTVNEGYTPTALNPSTKTSLTRGGVSNTNIAKVSIPRDLKFRVLKLHIVCTHSSFQIHSEFGISHSTPATVENIQQYSVLVPRESEIGVSSRGETRFHVFVNTTGSAFDVGYIQAEAHFVDSHSPVVNSSIAFSFLPNIWMGGLRVDPQMTAEPEYHADIQLENPALQKSGGVISVSAACTSTGSLVTRLDTKQSLYLHSRPGSSAVPAGSLAYVKETSPKTISLNRYDSLLIRCTFFGNPSPKINIFKMIGLHLDNIDIPSYIMSLPFESAAVFQFLNVTKETSGDYVCKGSNGERSVQTMYHISVQTEV